MHIECINVFKSFEQCVMCSTELCEGRPNIVTQSRLRAIRRNAFRDYYKIPFSHHPLYSMKFNILIMYVIYIYTFFTCLDKF